MLNEENYVVDEWNKGRTIEDIAGELYNKHKGDEGISKRYVWEYVTNRIYRINRSLQMKIWELERTVNETKKLIKNQSEK